jgi:hypothetical protein
MEAVKRLNHEHEALLSSTAGRQLTTPPRRKASGAAAIE